MNLNDYQAKSKSTAIYPGQGMVGGILYVSLGLSGEAGEVSNKVKKILRDDKRALTDTRRAEIINELGDTLWYIAMMATELHVTLDEVAKINVAKLVNRKANNTIHGAGDKR